MHAVEITSENFETVVGKDGVVILDFWASWCGPCRVFAPVFEKAASRHDDFTWGKIDTQAQPELAARDLDMKAVRRKVEATLAAQTAEGRTP